MFTIKYFLAAFILLFLPPFIHSENGCVPPEKIVTLLRFLRNNEWSSINQEKMKSVWPTPLKELTNEDGKGTTLSYEGRCSEEICYCSATFEFNIESKIFLKSVFLKYPAETVDSGIRNAKIFVQSLQPLTEIGTVDEWIPDSKTKTITRQYYWPILKLKDDRSVELWIVPWKGEWIINLTIL